MTKEPSSSKSPSTFPQEFEDNLNKELIVASLDDIAPSPGTPSLDGESSSSKSTSALTRGLQVPSKAKSPASGFEYPPALERVGISKDDWKRFSDEVRAHAGMTGKQWRETIGTATGTVFAGALMVGFLSAVPGVIVARKMRNKREKMNFKAASESGALLECIQRWNQEFFFQRGLAVRVDVPGSASDMARMDLSTSKDYKDRAETASLSTQSSNLKSESSYSDLLVEEGRARVKAAKRGRIVLIPLDSTASITTDPEQVILLPEERESATSG